ncbi:MAG: putative conserved repeat domain protein, partial [Phycisphaerales bacterium]|nr:putative conserved repeat domain protein [Phycisphaerales bacterium]
MRFLSRRQPGLATGVRTSRNDAGRVGATTRRGAAVLRQAIQHVEGLEERRLMAAQLTVVATPTPNTGTANAGALITYDVTVRNVSSEDATNVTLTDAFSTAAELNRAHVVFAQQNTGPNFSNFTGGPAGPITATVGRLNAALSATFTIILQTDDTTADGTIVSNTVSVTADNATPVQDQDDITITPRADVQVFATMADVTDPRFSVPAGSVVAGLNTTYTITVRNGGPSAARNVVLTDIIPSNTSFVSFTQVSGPTFAIPAGAPQPALPNVGESGTASASIDTLLQNQEAVFTLVVKVASNTPDAANITDTPVVTTATNDPVLGNDSFPVTSPVEIRTDVRITSSVDSLTQNIEGTFFPYTVNIINAGPSDAQSINFTWATPNLTVPSVPDYRVYYAKNAVDANGDPLAPVKYVTGVQFNISIPASPPPPPFGTFGGTVTTLPAGAGSVYQFFVGSPHQQDTTQHSTIS